MTDTCSKCGLPDDLCVCSDMAREDQQIEVTVAERRWGKKVTVVRGFDDDVDLDEIETKLKKALACGGTIKDGAVELQGDHRRRIEDALDDIGFDPSMVDVQ